jgi:uncharacterized protein YjiS (DUF1127 family)
MGIAMRMAGKSAPDWSHNTPISGERKARSNQGHIWHIPTGAAELRVIIEIFRMVSRWIDRSNQRNALADLDDYLLRDIGVSKDEALREASKPFWKS